MSSVIQKKIYYNFSSVFISQKCRSLKTVCLIKGYFCLRHDETAQGHDGPGPESDGHEAPGWCQHSGNKVLHGGHVDEILVAQALVMSVEILLI